MTLELEKDSRFKLTKQPTKDIKFNMNTCKYHEFELLKILKISEWLRYILFIAGLSFGSSDPAVNRYRDNYSHWEVELKQLYYPHEINVPHDSTI